MKLYEIEGTFNFKKSVEDYPFIGEVSCEVEIGKIVEYNGSYYSACILEPHHNAAGVRKVDDLNLDIDAETYAEPNVTCPVCGHSDDTSFELDNSGDDYECPRCGAILKYEREITVEYSASVVKLPKVSRDK